MMMMQETQDRLQLITEKQKLQTEVENKRRQLEDDRRTLQYLKSKTLRERWLLDGAPSVGPDQNQDQNQNQDQRQVDQDEAKTRTLEETIIRLEQELISLEIEDESQTIILPVAPGSKVKEVKVHTSPQINTTRESTEMKRAVYSVEITVERDKLTGQTRVLSTNTTLPVDLSQQGVKVYEDEQKVVHEVNGEDGVHLLSCSEVDELIHKADQACMMSHTVATVTESQEEAGPELRRAESQEAGPELRRAESQVAVEIVGLEAKAPTELDVSEASAEKPVTMVFMGYQSVEDEAETKRVLGLHGTVTAELVVIHDANGKTSSGGRVEGGARRAQTEALPPLASAASPPSAKPPAAMTPRNGEMAAGEAGPEAGHEAGHEAGREAGREAGPEAGREAGPEAKGVVDVKKKKQPCMCCSIM